MKYLQKKAMACTLAAVSAVTMIPVPAAARDCMEPEYEKPKYRNVLYFEEDAVNKDQNSLIPEYMDGSVLTHINFAYLDMDADGNLVLNDEYADFQAELSKTVENPGQMDVPFKGIIGSMRILREKYPNVRLGVSVGGWENSGDFSEVAASPIARENFSKNLAQFTGEIGFDYVDIDWECPGNERAPESDLDEGFTAGAEDKQNYTLLLESVKNALKASYSEFHKEFELSAVIPSDPEDMKNIECGKVLDIVDFASMSPDDQNVSVDDSLNYLKETCGENMDYSKIVVGSPAMGEYVKENGLGGLSCSTDELDTDHMLIKNMKESLFGSETIPVQKVVNPTAYIDVDDMFVFDSKTKITFRTQPVKNTDNPALLWSGRYYNTIMNPIIYFDLDPEYNLDIHAVSDCGTCIKFPGRVIYDLSTDPETKIIRPGVEYTFEIEAEGMTSGYEAGRITLTQRNRIDGMQYGFHRLDARGMHPGEPKWVPVLPIWNAAKEYKAGETVYYDGKFYQAKWWTKNEHPQTSWGAWEVVENTDPEGNVEDQPSLEAEKVNGYSSEISYFAGDLVYLENDVYEAQWSIKGKAPDDPDQWGVWKKAGTIDNIFYVRGN